MSRNDRTPAVELIVQPDDGLKPTLAAIEAAGESLDLLIFRFDLKPLEKAVEAAVKRGVAVRALIAHTNGGGDKGLRQLELRMLAAGVTVSRTADDLVRYHGKLMLVDRGELHVYGFNYTARDLKCRSFGLITRDRKAVQAALRLFEADAQREEFEPAGDGFVVSPANARDQLATFITGAKRRLVIWDPKVTDPGMIQLIRQRVKAGVDVRILGKVGKRGGDLPVQKLDGNRLHVRAMVRDGETAFVGSQSLRALELDARREVGLIVRDRGVVRLMLEVFDEDWAKATPGEKKKKHAGKDAVGGEDAVSA